MNISLKAAASLHKNVPPDWYYSSIRRNVLQRFWHRTRFREVSKYIKPVSGRILDVGSADGVFTKVILDKSQAREIIGIDVLESSVRWASKFWEKEKRMKFQLGNAHRLKFRDNTFDAVFALEVLEHVSDPDLVFREIRRVLKKEGYAIFLVPTDNRLFRIIWAFLVKFWWAKIWTDCHKQSFNKSNPLSDYAKRNGFKIIEDHKFLLGMLNLVKVKK